MPSVIALITYISKKWGDSLGGVVAGLPWVAGPIIYFIAIERGHQFAIDSIPGLMAGVISWFSFLVVYILLGIRYNPIISLSIGYIIYFAIGFFINLLIPSFSIHFWYVTALLFTLIVLYFFPGANHAIQQEERKLSFEIPLRMIAATFFVLAITFFSEMLGPDWSGILTPFPVLTTILAIFTHYTRGIKTTQQVFKGLMTGSVGFLTFFYLLTWLLPQMSLNNVFLIGISINLCLTLLMKQVLQKVGYF